MSSDKKHNNNLTWPFSVTRFSAVILLGVIFFLLPGNNCNAATISLQTRVRATVQGNKARLQLTITNNGNETAENIAIKILFQGRRRQISGLGGIGPAKDIKTRISLNIPSNIHGQLPIYITVSYQQDGTRRSQGLVAIAQTDTNSPASIDLRAAAVNKKDRVYRLTILAPTIKNGAITLVGHGPDGISFSPAQQQIKLINGQAQAYFTIIPTASQTVAMSCDLYWVAISSSPGYQEAVVTSAPFTYQPPGGNQGGNHLYIIAMGLGFLAFILTVCRGKKNAGTTIFVDILTIAAVWAALFAILPWRDIISPSIATGGDTASHYYTLHYLVKTLLPQGHISGWTMGNYAGFPILQFYFPLPFLIMKVFSLAMPLTVAFKLVTLLGTFLLPVSIYLMLRDLSIPFPGPALGAALSLLFLNHPANSMWGGNLLSTLAGEFSYSLSMALAILLMGSLYRGAVNNSRIIINAVLIFLVGFSHGYPLLFVEAVSIFLLFNIDDFTRRFIYLLKVYALGFLFLALWLIPLLAFGKFTTPYHTIWQIDTWKQIIPPLILPAAVGGAFFSPFIFILRKRLTAEAMTVTSYLWFALAISAVLYYAGPALGLVDIRFVPFGQLLTLIICAAGAGYLSSCFTKERIIAALLVLLIPCVIFWADGHKGSIPSWAKWNYSGFQKKAAWPLFKEINQTLAGNLNQPRVAVENSPQNNIFGSSRAFESLPLFAGRATLEGLYMQASPSAPFVFYIQSLISKSASRPFPQYHYDAMNFNRARPRLIIFNVRDLLLRSKKAKKAVRQARGYQLYKTIGPYELWRLTGNPGKYVVPLNIQPLVYKGNNVKEAAFQWFTNDHDLKIPIIFPQPGQKLPADSIPITSIKEPLPRRPLNMPPCEISEKIRPQGLDITTTCLERPVLIKVSYHPNWRVRGADTIYQVTPAFMLIYPRMGHITMDYKNGKFDYWGEILSGLGIFILIINLPFAVISRWRLGLLSRIRRLISHGDFMTGKLPCRRTIIIAVIGLLIIGTAVTSFQLKKILQKNPQRLFNAAIRDKDTRRYAAARQNFALVIKALPQSDMARNARYYIAACYYLQGLDSKAAAAFNKVIESDPHSPWRASAYYHLGILSIRNHDVNSGRRYLNMVLKKFPNGKMADYAKDKLRSL